jgi:hypothetical protein
MATPVGKASIAAWGAGALGFIVTGLGAVLAHWPAWLLMIFGAIGVLPLFWHVVAHGFPVEERPKPEDKSRE